MQPLSHPDVLVLHLAGASKDWNERSQAKEKIAMSEEEKVVDTGAAEEAETQQNTVTEEIKVQAQDLFQAINDIIREGTARRITIMRNDRVLVDIPLVIGLGASLILALNMPMISALAGLGALVGGCTLRIERENPSEES